MPIASRLESVRCMGKIRVLLADDHQAVLDSVCRILDEDFDIVGTVNNGQEAVVAGLSLDPDVLVIDISMPVINGLQATQRIRAKNRHTKIVFLTVHNDEDLVAAAFSSGASGYVIKADLTTDLVPAIHQAVVGGTYISKSIITS